MFGSLLQFTSPALQLANSSFVPGSFCEDATTGLIIGALFYAIGY